VVLGTDELLRQLKLKYFDEDVFTDVIAFRLNDEGKELEGEIYISPERAEENANTYGVPYPNELGRLWCMVLSTFWGGKMMTLTKK
jgi:rRNA maturation RNase YbeY